MIPLPREVRASLLKVVFDPQCAHRPDTGARYPEWLSEVIQPVEGHKYIGLGVDCEYASSRFQCESWSETAARIL